MIRVVHKECGKVAFYFRRKLNRGDAIEAANVINIDGTTPSSGTAIICGSCHKQFRPHVHNCEQQHWTDWFIVND